MLDREATGPRPVGVIIDVLTGSRTFSPVAAMPAEKTYVLEGMTAVWKSQLCFAQEETYCIHGSLIAFAMRMLLEHLLHPGVGKVDHCRCACFPHAGSIV